MYSGWYTDAMKSAIDHAGRLVIPKAVREAAGLVPGLELKIECRDGRVEIEPVCAEIKLVRKGSLTVAHAPGAPKLTLRQVNELIRDTRERRR